MQTGVVTERGRPAIARGIGGPGGQRHDESLPADHVRRERRQAQDELDRANHAGLIVIRAFDDDRKRHEMTATTLQVPT